MHACGGVNSWESGRDFLQLHPNWLVTVTMDVEVLYRFFSLITHREGCEQIFIVN